MSVGPLQNQGAQVDGFLQQSSFLEFIFFGCFRVNPEAMQPYKK